TPLVGACAPCPLCNYCVVLGRSKFTKVGGKINSEQKDKSFASLFKTRNKETAENQPSTDNEIPIPNSNGEAHRNTCQATPVTNLSNKLVDNDGSFADLLMLLNEVKKTFSTIQNITQVMKKIQEKNEPEEKLYILC
ncbi:hypothetical protein AVEN_160333-1, partial [Araneus ventricosus]